MSLGGLTDCLPFLEGVLNASLIDVRNHQSGKLKASVNSSYIGIIRCKGSTKQVEPTCVSSILDRKR